MKVDYFTLFAVMAFIDVIVVGILVHYIVRGNQRKRHISTYLLYKILESVAFIAFATRGLESTAFPVYIANIILFIAYFFHLTSLLAFDGKPNRKFARALGLATIIAVALQPFFASNDAARIIVAAIVLGSGNIAAGFVLLKDRSSYRLPVLLSIALIIFGVVNLTRIYSALYVKGFLSIDLTTLELLHGLSMLAIIQISPVGFLLLLKEVDESEIFRKNELNRVTIEQSPVSIVLTDVNGRIEYVNKHFSQLTGYKPGEVFGKKTSVLKSEFTPKETFSELWNTITSGQVWNGEFVNRKKNKELYYEEATIAPIKDKKGETINYIAIKSNISESKRNQKLIEQRTNELAELNSTKDRLFSIIAHDLKGPIGNQQQLLEFLEHDIADGDKENIAQLLKMLKQSAKTSADLLENLLAWSRSQLNSINLKTEQFDLAEATDEILKLVNIGIRQKKIEIIKKYDGKYPVYADKPMIETVVRNLLSNAVKFTAERGSIELNIEFEDGNTILSIADNGVGIPEERSDSVFNFAKNQSTRGTAGEKGTGLGLVLSKEFVEKNKGSIWFESEVDIGTTFFVSLPSSNRAQQVEAPLTEP
jgi:PAS domain S-box-containing protein